MDNATLQQVLKDARERYEAMTPEEKEEMWIRQRESYIRAMMPTGDPRFD